MACFDPVQSDEIVLIQTAGVTLGLSFLLLATSLYNLVKLTDVGN